MSMNIYLKAELVGEFKTKNKSFSKKVQENFDCIQTPTEVTKRILQSENKYEEYKKFLTERGVQNNHLKELDKFLSDYSDWDLVWYEL
jgi:hypothetical protein